MWTKNFQMYKLDLEKAEEPEIKWPTSTGSQKNKKNPKENTYFCFIDFSKPLLSITTNYGKFLKRWQYQTTLPVSWETCMQDKKQQLELDLNNRLVQNWERTMSRLYIVTLPI